MIDLLLELFGTLGGLARVSFMSLAVVATLYWAITFQSATALVLFLCMLIFAVVRWLRSSDPPPQP